MRPSCFASEIMSKVKVNIFCEMAFRLRTNLIIPFAQIHCIGFAEFRFCRKYFTILATARVSYVVVRTHIHTQILFGSTENNYF